jgi:hypothetical protein
LAKKVSSHIEDYTVPQYGDKNNDQASDYEPEEFILQIKRYIARFGKNSRPGQDELDLLKIAHYAQMTYTLIQEKKDAKK